MTTGRGFPVNPWGHGARLTAGVTHLNAELSPLTVREVDHLLQGLDVAIVLQISIANE